MKKIISDKYLRGTLIFIFAMWIVQWISFRNAVFTIHFAILQVFFGTIYYLARRLSDRKNKKGSS